MLLIIMARHKKPHKRYMNCFKRFLVFTLFLPCLAVAQNCKLAVLSVNDMHGAYTGIANLMTLSDSLRSLYPDFLLFSAGDNRTGNPFNDFYTPPSMPMTALMNFAGFDASAVGNHEFDSDFDDFKTNMKLSYFPYLMANGYAADSLEWKFEPYRIFETHSGVKVAVVGLIELNSRGIPDVLPSQVSNFTFENPLERAKDFYGLRDSCNVFIYLTHLGASVDTLLARQSAGVVDAIIGGHSHTLIKDGATVDGVLITQAEKSLMYATLTVFDIVDGKVKGRSCQTFDLSEFKPHPAVTTLVGFYSNSEKFNKVVTVFDKDYLGTQAVGAMKVEALKNACGVDIVVQNYGGVRVDSIFKGVFTLADLYRLDPFDNDIVIYELTPSEIDDLLTACQKADKRRRPITSWYERGKLKKCRYYKVAVNTFIDETADFKHKREPRQTGVKSNEALIRYFSAQKK